MKSESSARKVRRKRGVYLLPNIFTTTNLFFGFYSVLASTQGNYYNAALVIVLAITLDALDGRIARMTNTMSQFGAEYDSLADLVAFGVAPAILAYYWTLHAYGKWGLVVAFLFVACGALRLARFNVQIGIIESRVFNGLAIPAAAAVVATGVMFYFYIGGTGKYPNAFIMPVMVALALLMVSNIKYYSFKELNFFSRKPFMSFVLIIIILIIVYVETEITLFTFAIGYALSGPAWWFYGHSKKAAKEKNKESITVIA